MEKNREGAEEGETVDLKQVIFLIKCRHFEQKVLNSETGEKI